MDKLTRRERILKKIKDREVVSKSESVMGSPLPKTNRKRNQHHSVPGSLAPRKRKRINCRSFMQEPKGAPSTARDKENVLPIEDVHLTRLKESMASIAAAKNMVFNDAVLATLVERVSQDQDALQEVPDEMQWDLLKYIHAVDVGLYWRRV